MSLSANQYHVNLVQGILASDLGKWEHQISHAEQQRIQDITVMDIIGASKPSGEDRAQSGVTGGAIGVVAEWIQLAIVIEEKQYVTFDC